VSKDIGPDNGKMKSAETQEKGDRKAKKGKEARDLERKNRRKEGSAGRRE